MFAKEGPGPKNHSEIGSDILYHKFQEMDRMFKSMIAMYSSNYRSIPVLCLPLTLLSFEGGNRSGTMEEEGVPHSARLSPVSARKKLRTEGCTFVRSAKKAAVFVGFHGMIIDSFMDFSSCS